MWRKHAICFLNEPAIFCQNSKFQTLVFITFCTSETCFSSLSPTNSKPHILWFYPEKNYFHTARAYIWKNDCVIFTIKSRFQTLVFNFSYFRELFFCKYNSEALEKYFLCTFWWYPEKKTDPCSACMHLKRIILPFF